MKAKNKKRNWLRQYLYFWLSLKKLHHLGIRLNSLLKELATVIDTERNSSNKDGFDAVRDSTKITDQLICPPSTTFPVTNFLPISGCNSEGVTPTYFAHKNAIVQLTGDLITSVQIKTQHR